MGVIVGVRVVVEVIVGVCVVVGVIVGVWVLVGVIEGVIVGVWVFVGVGDIGMVSECIQFAASMILYRKGESL